MRGGQKKAVALKIDMFKKSRLLRFQGGNCAQNNRPFTRETLAFAQSPPQHSSNAANQFASRGIEHGGIAERNHLSRHTRVVLSGSLVERRIAQPRIGTCLGARALSP